MIHAFVCLVLDEQFANTFSQVFAFALVICLFTEKLMVQILSL